MTVSDTMLGWSEGCVGCRSASLAELPIAQLPIHDLSLKGSVLQCRHCSCLLVGATELSTGGELFPDPWTKAMESLRQGGHRFHLLDSEARYLGHVRPVAPDLYELSLGPYVLSRLGLELTHVLFYCAAWNTRVTGRFLQLVRLTFDGYQDDSREVWQIPEVLGWCLSLHNRTPWISYWLAQDSICVYYLILARTVGEDFAQRVAESLAADHPSRHIITDSAGNVPRDLRNLAAVVEDVWRAGNGVMLNLLEPASDTAKNLIGHATRRIRPGVETAWSTLRIADLRRRIDEVRAEMDRAERVGDLNRAAELRYRVLLNLERELAVQQGDAPKR